MVPSDSDNIKKEYLILNNELKQYSPELMDKSRILAVTKSDLLDEELINEIKKDLPDNIPYVFISSVTQTGLVKLKDIIWKCLNETL
jgi:GTP-binding protein